MNGTVYLVGAGPGAEDLITLRALRVLEKAHVVLYDRLANSCFLKYAPAGAPCLDVGKYAGEKSASRQNRINQVMVKYARAGKTVVRLKGGDPFVFGRGGEEVLALREAGIRAEIVPGISSCVAAPSSVSIPLTMRGYSSAFGVFTGHPGEEASGDGFDWGVAAAMPTAVFLMGVKRLPLIVARLLEHGRDPATPVAIIERATLPDERSVVGTLATILELSAGFSSPATIVVGEVASLHRSNPAMLVGNRSAAAVPSPGNYKQILEAAS